MLYEGRTNLDTLAWRTGRLVIGVFDDDRPGGPVDFIVIKWTAGRALAGSRCARRWAAAAWGFRFGVLGLHGSGRTAPEELALRYPVRD